MSLPTLNSVQKLRTALHAKAKGAPETRFYTLYDKVYRPDVLWQAHRRCRINGGVPGVDGQTFGDIEQYGLTKWLEELAEELRKKTYQPQPVRRVYIPKPDGKQRPLGIPTIRDRVVQTAVLLILEPIFEADLQPEQHAYREGRDALEAVQAVHRLLNTGYTEVVDADLSGYFDTIPHAELMQCVARRVSDKALLHLLKLWLVAPAEELDRKGHVHRTTRNKDEGRGTPQGASVSVIGEPVHAPVRAGLENAGTPTEAGGSHHQLRRRLRDLLPGHGQRGPDRHAAHDVADQADGERDQNACLSGSCGNVRLPGLHLRKVLCAQTGRAYFRVPDRPERKYRNSVDRSAH